MVSHFKEGQLEFSDQEMIRLIRQGDMNAYQQVFKTFYKPLHGYAYQLIKDATPTEDIVQDVFYRVWKKKEKLIIHSSLRSYLYASVHHECLSYLKRGRRSQKYQATMSYEQKNTGANDDTASKLLAAELKKKFTEALNDLPEGCRTVFHLNRFENLTYREVAAALGLSVKTVESQMGKALRHLRLALVEFLPLFIFILCQL
jgi:RNA polymerase sigma-70 factor, ECF subfamily